jgi:hypothetical protein
MTLEWEENQFFLQLNRSFRNCSNGFIEEIFQLQDTSGMLVMLARAQDCMNKRCMTKFALGVERRHE